MGKLNALGILARLAGLSALATDVTFTQGITQLLGPNASKVIAIIAVTSAVAGEIIHIYQTQPPDPSPPHG
jgi:hypothetical protein